MRMFWSRYQNSRLIGANVLVNRSKQSCNRYECLSQDIKTAHSIMLKRNTTKNKTKTKNKTNKTNYKVQKQHYYIDAHEIVRFRRRE